eukprot:TRINITY_DN5265_c0_g3_i1.p1 TRINITY_DN5265_c0_g3~~TRINITY_DN5265_c0_g3_i1.p1  ORF type:complete len:308 (-),score=50.74 TRINITY_DN5265_c0_g3_i1:23-946(-)
MAIFPILISQFRRNPSLCRHCSYSIAFIVIVVSGENSSNNSDNSDNNSNNSNNSKDGSSTKSSNSTSSSFGTNANESTLGNTGNDTADLLQQQQQYSKHQSKKKRSLVMSIALLTVATATAFRMSGPVANLLGNGPGANTAAMAGCSWIIGGLLRCLKRHKAFVNEAAGIGRKCGSFLMLIFFAAIGAQASFRDVISGSTTAAVTSFAAICLTVHALTLISTVAALNWLLRRKQRRDSSNEYHITLEEVLVASNANVGGAATSAAFAGASLGKSDLVLSATCCGILGYVVATALGIILASFLGWRPA